MSSDITGSTSCVSDAQKNQLLSLFRAGLYEYSLILALEPRISVSVDVSVDVHGTTIGSFAYCIPLRSVIQVLPHIRFAVAFDPFRDKGLPLDLELRNVLMVEQYKGVTHAAPWIVFRYAIRALYPNPNLTVTERCSEIAADLAARTKEFRSTTYHTKVVASCALRREVARSDTTKAGVAEPQGRRRCRPWRALVGALGRCGRFFSRRPAVVAAPETETEPLGASGDLGGSDGARDVMPVQAFVSETIVDADDNLTGALQSVLFSNVRVHRAATMAAIVDTCATIEAVARVRTGMTDVVAHMEVFEPKGEQPVLHFTTLAVVSLTDVYLHMLRNLHDSIRAIEITTDEHSHADVWVFLRGPCHESVTEDAEARLGTEVRKVEFMRGVPPHRLSEDTDVPIKRRISTRYPPPVLVDHRAELPVPITRSTTPRPACTDAASMVYSSQFNRATPAAAWRSSSAYASTTTAPVGHAATVLASVDGTYPVYAPSLPDAEGKSPHAYELSPDSP